MKARTLVFCVLVAAAATSAHADSASYAQCGTYDAYLLVYKTTERFEEIGKLRCGEKVEILNQKGSFAQIRTIDGRTGWVRFADLSDAPPPPQHVYTFGLSEAAKPVEPSAPKPPVSVLTTDDVLAMHAMHPGSDFLLKKISSNPCAFDMTPPQIQRLRAAGVSDKVILAMLQAPVATGLPPQKTPEGVDVKVPDGTAFEVELRGNVSSEDVQEGTIVEMQAAEDLVVDGVPIVVRGSEARARVLAVRPAGAHGGSGVVAWFMQDIVATNGERIPLNFAVKQPGNDRPKNFEGYPYFLSGFHKDTPAIKASDKRFRVVVHGDAVLTVNQSLTAAVPKRKTQSVRHVSAQPAAQSQSAAPQQTAPDEAKP
jgi:Bacterial SH3 domain